jgi:hypothetical protein
LRCRVMSDRRDQRKKAEATARDSLSRRPLSKEQAAEISAERIRVFFEKHEDVTPNELDYLEVIEPLFGGPTSKNEVEEVRRKIAANLIERGRPVPQPLRAHVVEILRQPLPVAERERKIRNISIAFAVSDVVHATGLKPTRGREQKKVESACAVVAKVSKWTEPTVEKAWEEWGRAVEGLRRYFADKDELKRPVRPKDGS